nr:reverse transcriptase family protein [uncultured Rhodopila sp.]
MPKSSEIKRYALDQSPLYKLANRKKLAGLLKISTCELRTLSRAANSLYREFPVLKKNGGTRDVENPARQLKLVQARLARWLSRIAPPDYLFCPVKGRCYVGNAALHRGQRVVHCLDVRKYFPSTPARRVFWFFHKVMKCERDVAATLTALSTYQGHLPTGSPLSPILAYYAHYDVWQAIASICREYGYKLSVYIDDVTVSGASICAAVLWRIKKEIHRSGLRYHKEKSYYDGISEITGVIVSGDRLNTPNRQHKKIVAIKAQIRATRRDVEAEKLREKLGGLYAQARQVSAMASERPVAR